MLHISFLEMGNVNGRNEKTSEEYMEYANVDAQVSMVHSPPHTPPRVYPHPQIPYDMMQNPNNALFTRNTKHSDNVHSEMGIPTMIVWCYDGKEVAVQGSWDCWKTREFLQQTSEEFAVVKVLPPGVYHYRYIVDGQWRYSPDLAHQQDDMGNVFNVLDVKRCVPPVLNDMPQLEPPSSPVSSYNNSPFTEEDFYEKLPELPPLMQQSLLDQPLSSDGSLEKPLPSVLNHLYICKGRGNQSLTALSSTHRFQSKNVTIVLYKPRK